MTSRVLLLFGLMAAFSDCSTNACAPGETRPCSVSLDGGASLRGTQTCSSSGAWFACLGAGACTGGSARAPYARCDTDAQCGPSDCAQCGRYAGVENPDGYGMCFPYCAVDADCAPTITAAGITPHCVLGQCTLRCAAGARCPNDTACLPWANAALAAANPGVVGLCQ